MNDLVATFVFFFAVVDPIGIIPVFIAATSGYASSDKRRIALTATLASAIILLFFVIAGELILTAMAIPLEAFQIAGGIVLFLFALTMIFGESKPGADTRLAEGRTETAIFPLAVPSIASPGAMLAAVLLTENERYTVGTVSDGTRDAGGSAGLPHSHARGERHPPADRKRRCKCHQSRHGSGAGLGCDQPGPGGD